MPRKPKAEQAPDDVQAMIAAVPIRVWPIGRILIDPTNANTHDRRSIAGIKGSIAKFGQVEPLLVREATGVLIGGEGRLIAMQELGFDAVEVRPLDVDATTATGLSLALNRTAELSSFDPEILVAQLRALDSDGFDVSALGWNDAEMTALLTLEAAAGQSSAGKPDDPNEEWQGMPGFESEDKSPARTLLIHFRSLDDVRQFSSLIGQKIPDKEGFIWYPAQEEEKPSKNPYVDQS